MGFARKVINKTAGVLFPVFEKLGIHVLPVDYYSPIPDSRELARKAHLFNVEHPMYGVDLREETQLEFVEKVLKRYEKEYVAAGDGRFGTDPKEMPSFAPVNGLALFSMIRHFKPANVIEVGAGKSTSISSAAMAQNLKEGIKSTFTVIEPFPAPNLLDNPVFPINLVQKKVESMPLEFFDRLRANDILFIDSTHTVKIFGDVNYLYLSVLPRLNPGVIVHIHDIFFPVDYLPHHFFNRGMKQIWQEQYLLQAFLAFNTEFEILLSLSWAHFKHIEKLKSAFDWYTPERWPSSFWMRRKSSD